jgi:hypothetical protein
VEESSVAIRFELKGFTRLVSHLACMQVATYCGTEEIVGAFLVAYRCCAE